MKINLSKCLTASLIAFAVPASANVHKFALGAEGFSYKYREPGVMADKGNLYGVSGEYSYAWSNGIFIQPELRYAYGKTSYRSHRTGRMGRHTPNHLVETRFLTGYTHSFSPTLTITPFIGLGYRYKRDESAGMVSSTGHYGYHRESNYLYIPIGLKANQQLGEKCALEGSTEYDVFIGGRQHSHLPSGSVSNDQHHGYGARAELLLSTKFTTSKLAVGPFINYWKIKDSKVESGVYEPRNTTTELGVKIKYTF